MRVLIAYERSGKLRRRFRRMGHECYSCDLAPADDGETTYHIQRDITDALRFRWDLMIAHPVCTFLTVANAGYVKNGCSKYSAEEARRLQDEALQAVWRLRDSDIPLWAIENPVGILSTHWRKPDQIVQPYQFGDDASKKTCLWLKGLPLLPLDPAKFVSGRIVGEDKRGRTIPRWSNQTDSGQNRLSPSPDRSRLRAITYSGIADAMAATWGNL